MALILHTALYLAARGISALIAVVSIAVYTRILSTDEYGNFSLAISSVAAANALCFYWMRAALLRFYHSKEFAAEGLLYTIRKSYLVVSLFVVLLTATVVIVSQPNIPLSLITVSVLVLLGQAWIDLNLELDRIMLKPVRYGIRSAVRAIASLAFGVVFVIAGFRECGPVIGLLLGCLVAAAIAMQRWKLKSKSSPVPVATLLKYGLPLTASFGLAIVVARIDRFLLLKFLTSDIVGIYSAGYDLTDQAIILAMMITCTAGYPLAMKSFEEDGSQALTSHLEKYFLVLIATSLPVLLAFVFYSGWISGWAFGKEFAGATVVVMPIIALGSFLAGIKSYYFDLSFQFNRSPMTQVWITVAALVVNVFLNIALIPSFAVLGCAVATVITYAFALALSFFYGQRCYPVPLPFIELRKLFMPLIVLITLPVILGALGMPTLLTLIVAFVAYLAALISSGVMREQPAGRLAQPQVYSFFMSSFNGGGAERVAINLANEFGRRGIKTEVVVARNEGPLGGGAFE